MRTQFISLGLAFILLCSYASAQWVRTNGTCNGGIVESFASNGTTLFAGINGCGVLRSTDDGLNWSPVNSGLPELSVQALAVIGNNLFVGTYWGNGIFLSTDNGTNWTPVNAGLPTNYAGLTNIPILSLAVSGTNLFAGSDEGGQGKGVYLSTNNGISWSAANNGLPHADNLYCSVWALTVSGTHVYCATRSLGIFFSLDNGASWTSLNGFPTGHLEQVWTVAASGNNVYAMASVGEHVITPKFFYVSTNNGATWTVPDSTRFDADGRGSVAVVGSNIFAGYRGGVYLSTNGGTTWSPVNGGLADSNICTVAALGSYLFAGTCDGSVWRRALSDMVSSVEGETFKVPHAFALSQNYPNPFNPSTTITYELPKSSQVRLSVYDILGREVSVLVNERRDAGVHEVQFDGSNLPSGVYFYRIEVRPLDSAIGRDSKSGAGSFVQTRKLLLIR